MILEKRKLREVLIIELLVTVLTEKNPSWKVFKTMSMRDFSILNNEILKTLTI